MPAQPYAPNVFPFYVAPSARAETPALVTLARHPWREADVAEALGKSTRTIRRYMARGLPSRRRFGARGVVCFAPRDVLTWWASNRAG